MEKFEYEGGIYEGEAINGVPNGQGKLTYSNGTTYEGAFKNGVPNGLGTFTDGDGHAINFEWKDGKAPNGMTPCEIEELRVFMFKKIDSMVDDLIEKSKETFKKDSDENNGTDDNQ